MGVTPGCPLPTRKVAEADIDNQYFGFLSPFGRVMSQLRLGNDLELAHAVSKGHR